MKPTLSKQYNNFADIFSIIHDNGNKFTNRVFFNELRSCNLQSKNILDLGCGNGTDVKYYKYRFSENVSGIDASEELLKEAKKDGLDVACGYFDNIPFPDKTFDVVVSKYALQTAYNFEEIYKEVNRVLKKSGVFIFLIVHPFRQFFEKKSKCKNYFEKKIVKSVLFNGALTVEEPAHTMQEYLSPEFFKNFLLESFTEKADFYSAEKIGTNNYPTYMIIVGKKI